MRLFLRSLLCCLMLLGSVAFAADRVGRDDTLRDNTTGDKVNLRLHDNGDGTYSIQVYTGAGGGGGAATVADGADVTQGAKADVAASSDTGTFSLIALFKRSLQTLTSIATKLDSIITNTAAATPAGANTIGKVGIDQTTPGTTNAVAIADGANVTQGAKADAKSTATDTTPVTIVSLLKQISASVQAPPSQAVTGPLTDAQLRATPVPVSGTVTVTDGAGALNVIVDSGTTAATQSGTWTVQPGNTANTTAWNVAAATKQLTGTPSSFTIQTADQTVFTLAAGEVGFIQNLSADAPMAVKYGSGASTTSLNYVLPVGTAASDGKGGVYKIDDWVGVVSVAKMTGTASYLAWKRAP